MLCIKCNEYIGTANRACRACGTWNSESGQSPKPSSPQPQVSLQDVKPFTTSLLFILGCLLITIGTVGSIFVEFTWLNLLGLAFAMVHIIGLWLLVFDGFSSDASYSKTLTALSMFRVSAILTMILFCIAFGIMGIGVLFAMLRGIAFLFIIAVAGGIAYVLVRYYFLALLKVLDGIRSRIESNKFVPLEGINSFLVFSYILIGLSILDSILGMAGTYTPQHVHVTSGIHVDTQFVVYDAVVQGGAFSVGIVFVIINSIGMILCLRTLKRFDN